jgi:ligand-binding sensor domain-containing protein
VASRPVSDGRGGFWFLNQGAIWRFDARGYQPLGKADGFPEAPVDQAHPEPSSGMWFHSGKAWFHLDAAGLRPVPNIPEPDPAGNRSFFAVRNEGFAVIQDGRLLLFTSSRMAPIDLPAPGPGKWTRGWRDLHSQHRLMVGDAGWAQWDGSAWRVKPLKGVLAGRPWDVVRDRLGAVWIRSDRDLIQAEPSQKSYAKQLGFTRNSFVSLELDAFGRVWTNGPEGLACIDGHEVWRLGEREGLYGYQAYWPIAFDAHGTLWTISASGFQCLKGGFLWRVLEEPHGLPRAMTFTIRRLQKDRALYVGTHDGLYRQGPEKWELIKGTEGWALFSMTEHPSGDIWVCGNPPNPQDQAVLRIQPGQRAQPVVIQGFPQGVWANVLRWTDAQTLWCGTDKGLFRLHAEGARWVAESIVAPGLGPDTPIGDLMQTQDGTLWVATGQGLFSTDGKTWTAFGKARGLIADDVAGLFAGPHGTLWICHENGISCLTHGTGGWVVSERMEREHPLASVGAVEGWTDPNGLVWMRTGSEVIRWDGRQVERHTRAFGLPIDTLFGIWGEPDGRLWVGSISGLISYDPRFYRPIPHPPALVTGPSLDGRGMTFKPGDKVPYRKPGVTFSLQLPLVEGVEDLSVQTRLVGLDEVWRHLEGNELRFPGLPGGSYVLEARAARRDGVMGPTLSIPFRVLPPWYQRAWARLGWGLLAVAGVALAMRWRTRSLLRDKTRLGQLVEERTSDLVAANTALAGALRDVKTLKGLVPICSYCKKIRDDKGFWTQLEQVLANRTEAQLSHGICPDCATLVMDEFKAEHST